MFEIFSFNKKVSSTQKEENVDVGKRKFVKGASIAVANLAILSTGAKALWEHEYPVQSELPKVIEADPEILPSVLESPQIEKRAESFQGEIIGYSRMLPLRFDEVQFVYENGAPIGKPLNLKDVDVDPGPLNEQGIPIDGIRGQWLDAARLKLQAEFPDVVLDSSSGIPNQYNVVAQFRAALSESDEPELTEKIKSGEITRAIDIVDYFANKPVKGASEFSRFEYVQNEIVFKDSVPKSIQAELRKIIPTLCVQESGFNNDVTSKTGAKGIFQFMPKTWKQYNNDESAISSLKTQVDVAGQFFSDLYTQVKHWCGREELQFLEVQCGSHESFEVELLVPLIINSYNTGAKCMGDAVKFFVKMQKEKNTMFIANNQFDLFASIVDLAKESSEGTLDSYGEHARSYVPRIYGHALALHQMKDVHLANN